LSAPGPVRQILVAVDFSPQAERAFDMAISLAKALSARLHLFHSYMDLPAQLLERNVWIPEDVWERVRREDAARLEKLRERATAAGVEAELHQSPMRPSEAIVKGARDLGVDLIVMGTRGNSGLKHVLLGSVAERTLRSAPCPVLAVPDPDRG